MYINHKVKTFLDYKLVELRIGRKEFIENSGISASHVSLLLNARQRNPSLTNIVKIADYFGTSVDEVIGRQCVIKITDFKKLSSTEMTSNLKFFLVGILTSKNINAYILERYCNIGRSTILNFINGDNMNRGLSLATIIPIADYLNCSVDRMIGRVDRLV